MSALGYEFANREDVWRILSYANYYPVLIQVFCQGLLHIIEEQTVRNAKVIKIIDGKMIDSAMVDNQIRKALYESFDKTITHIEQRYELLTYIIAERALIDAGEGVDGDGLTASEVTERAGRYWPEGFPKGSDPSEVEYLLDEMEGFGILRWTASGRWALRSRTLGTLLLDETRPSTLPDLERFEGALLVAGPYADPEVAAVRLGDWVLRALGLLFYFPEVALVLASGPAPTEFAHLIPPEAAHRFLLLAPPGAES